MINNNKILKLIEGIVTPIVLYVGVSFFLVLLLKILDIDINEEMPIVMQGYSNAVLIILFTIFYISFCKRNKILYKNINFNGFIYILPMSFSLSILGNVLIDMFIKTSENEVSKEVLQLLNDGKIPIVFILVIVLAPIIEEILFRGFIYDTIKDLANYKVAILLQSLLFAVFHGNIEQGIYAFAFGIILGYIRMVSNSIVGSITMHMMANFSILFFSSNLVLLDDLKSKLYIIFIMITIFIASLKRYNDKNGISLRKE